MANKHPLSPLSLFPALGLQLCTTILGFLHAPGDQVLIHMLSRELSPHPYTCLFKHIVWGMTLPQDSSSQGPTVQPRCTHHPTLLCPPSNPHRALFFEDLAERALRSWRPCVDTTYWIVNTVEGESVTTTIIQIVFLGPHLKSGGSRTHSVWPHPPWGEITRVGHGSEGPLEVHWQSEGSCPNSDLPAPTSTRHVTRHVNVI